MLSQHNLLTPTPRLVSADLILFCKNVLFGDGYRKAAEQKTVLLFGDQYVKRNFNETIKLTKQKKTLYISVHKPKLNDVSPIIATIRVPKKKEK